MEDDQRSRRAVCLCFCRRRRRRHPPVCIICRYGTDSPSQPAQQQPCPTNNALSINFLLSSDAEIFVTNHRLGIQVGTKTCKKTCAQRVRISTELPFCMPPLLVGWGREREREREQTQSERKKEKGGPLLLPSPICPPSPFLLLLLLLLPLDDQVCWFLRKKDGQPE